MTVGIRFLVGGAGMNHCLVLISREREIYLSSPFLSSSSSSDLDSEKTLFPTLAFGAGECLQLPPASRHWALVGGASLGAGLVQEGRGARACPPAGVSEAGGHPATSSRTARQRRPGPWIERRWRGWAR